MKKINRGDLSVYITLGLVGAGVGLLISSAVYAYFKNRRENDTDKKESDYESEAQEHRDEETWEGDSDAPWDDKEESDGPDRRDHGGRGNGFALSKAEEKELERLKLNYTVSRVEENLVTSGQLPISDLEHTLIIDGRTVDTLMAYDKPDLSTFFEDEPDDSQRFLIRNINPLRDPSMADFKIKKITKLKFDGSDDKLVRAINANRNVNVDDTDELIGEGTLDTIIELLMFGSDQVLYVVDTESSKAYSVEMMSDGD